MEWNERYATEKESGLLHDMNAVLPWNLLFSPDGQSLGAHVPKDVGYGGAAAGAAATYGVLPYMLKKTLLDNPVGRGAIGEGKALVDRAVNVVKKDPEFDARQNRSDRIGDELIRLRDQRSRKIDKLQDKVDSASPSLDRPVTRPSLRERLHGLFD